MTLDQFKLEYDKLAKVYPYDFGNEFKERAVFNYIKDLEKKWWAALVNRIILSSNPKLNIEEAAQGERRARKSLELTSGVLAMQDKLAEQISENGLSEALKAFGANSLLDVLRQK